MLGEGKEREGNGLVDVVKGSPVPPSRGYATACILVAVYMYPVSATKLSSRLHEIVCTYINE